MGLFGRAKKDSEKFQYSLDKKKEKPIEDETFHEEIIELNKEIQDAAVKLRTYSQELEKTKTELDAVTLEVKNAREEVEDARSEIKTIKAERDSILSQVKNSKEELELIKSQYVQNNVDRIKRQINEVQYELSQANSEKEAVASELEELRSKALSTKEEYEKISSDNEMKRKEIALTKKELEFIESELATVGRSDNTKKIVEAAGAVAASINAKYEETRKELEIIKVALARTKEEY
jgi:chromosome segregation ATPase